MMLNTLELKLRYPDSRQEDITDAFTRGYTAATENAHKEIAKLRELALEIWHSCPVTEDDCARCPHHIEEDDEIWCDIPLLMESVGIEVK